MSCEFSLVRVVVNILLCESCIVCIVLHQMAWGSLFLLELHSQNFCVQTKTGIREIPVETQGELSWIHLAWKYHDVLFSKICDFSSPDTASTSGLLNNNSMIPFPRQPKNNLFLFLLVWWENDFKWAANPKICLNLAYIRDSTSWLY